MNYEVIIGRLKRKIEKLKNQRDFHMKENLLMRKMITMYPHIKSSFNTYQNFLEDQKRLKTLEARTKEQEFLIRILLKDSTVRDFDIKHEYDRIIKEEHRKVNNEIL